ncbi:MAG: galactarate dehydratase [Saprospiraceae bacterium]|nr:galactarate dehydratase [Saprospiraceae bacterium]
MATKGKNTIIQTTPNDNVGIVANVNGLEKGMEVNGITAKDAIPMGHKMALCDLEIGDKVIRYGQTIGYAKTKIGKGEWVDALKMDLPQPPDLDSIPMPQPKRNTIEPLEGYTFQGFRNTDGSVGTKNVLGITTSVQCVAGMTDFVVKKIKAELLPRFPNVDDVVALNHSYGCGVAIDAPAAIIPIRTVRNLAQNPNFGGELMIIGLGCEKLQPNRLLNDSVTDASILFLQDEAFTGFSEMVEGIMQIAERHLHKLNARQRTTCPASDLVVGMQCGGSDAFSGITGNPASGFAADLIVRAGGTVFFSEVTEVRDAVHLLVPRTTDPSVAQALLNEMAWYDHYLAQGSADRSANPTPGNKRGGLSNVVEKALGSIAKSGTSPIVDVVAPGDKVRRKGLNFVATPASDFVCGTLQMAAGMNIHVFITGRGTPYGLAAVPVVKVSSNSKLGNRWFDLIDFDAGPIAEGTKTIEEAGWDLFHLILEVASGKRKVAADTLGIHNDLVLFNPAPLT